MSTSLTGQFRGIGAYERSTFIWCVDPYMYETCNMFISLILVILFVVRRYRDILKACVVRDLNSGEYHLIPALEPKI